MAQRCHPRRAIARGGWLGLYHDLLGQCSQRLVSLRADERNW